VATVVFVVDSCDASLPAVDTHLSEIFLHFHLLALAVTVYLVFVMLSAVRARLSHISKV